MVVVLSFFIPLAMHGQDPPLFVDCGYSLSGGDTPGACLQTAVVDHVIMIDEAFLSIFSGNLAEARAYALHVYGEATQKMESLVDPATFAGIDYFCRYFPTDLGRDAWYPGPEQPLATNWASNIKNYWNTEKNCIDHDGIIYFTGQNTGYRGWNYSMLCESGIFTNKGNIIIVKYEAIQGSMARTLAHELGHQIGWVHTQQTSCKEDCQSGNGINNPLMCQYYNGERISTCDVGCLRYLFSELRCPCLVEALPGYPDDFTCGPDKYLTLVTDNPNTLINCVSGDEFATFTLTFRNGSQAGNYNIRAYVAQNASQKYSFVVDPAHEFNCIVPLANGAKEFRITDPTCGAEKIFSFQPNEIKILQFKVQQVADVAPGETAGYPITAYVGGNSPGSSYISTIQWLRPYAKVNVAKLSSLPIIQSEIPLHIVGNSLGGNVGVFEVDQDYDFGRHKKIRFGPEVDMRIKNNKTAKMPMMDIRGCQNMWKSITVYPGATLDVSMSNVEDGQFALQCRKGGSLSVINSTLRNNNFGIITSTEGTGYYKITALGNRYLCTALKAPYANQLPAPSSKGFAGIYVDNSSAGLNVGEGPVAGFTNEFSGLHFGIIAKNTTVNIGKSIFTNIQQSPMPVGYTAYIGAQFGTGKGIYAEGKSVTMTGMGTAADDFPNFENCYTGIETFGAGLNASNNKMHAVVKGIVSKGTVNRSINISDNSISAERLGIGISEQREAPSQCTVSGNAISITGLASSIGISIGASKSSALSVGAKVTNNTITMSGGTDGIWLGDALRVTTERNTVLLQNTADNRTGIRVDGGAFNTVNCNTVTGTGTFADAKGIHGLLAGQSAFLCNTANGANYGLSFEGVAVGYTGSLPISGNRMNNSTEAGLLLGADALVGPQPHRGNRWNTTGGQTVAIHLGGVGLADQSKFTVDALENAAFLPNLVDPFAWFDDVNDPASSYTCDPLVLCPIEQATGDGPTDRNIARGDLRGLAHPVAQIWLAQRRLSERIQTDGNPYPGDPDFANFITASQSNGLAAYAQVQVGMRQMLALSAADRAQLSGYEAQISQAMPLLNQAEAALHQYNLSAQDSATWAQQRDSLLQVLETVGTNQSTKLNLMSVSQATTLSNLLSLNASLTGSSTWQMNEKAVNEVWLNTLAVGIFEFSAAQRTTLENIAAQCPVADGEAVLRARAMLTLVQDAPVYYDDTALCSGREQQTLSDVSGAAVRVYPNPASDKIVVEYALTTSADNNILLFNAFGQVVGTVNLPNQTGRIQISVAHLPAGVYWYAVPGAVISTGKFIINR